MGDVAVDPGRELDAKVLLEASEEATWVRESDGIEVEVTPFESDRYFR